MENLIEIKNLCKNYGNFTLDHVSFALPKGSIMGFIGENGAGKTTTIKAMLGLIRPDGGEISLLGRQMPADDREIKMQLGVVLDECCFHNELSPKYIHPIMARIYPTWDQPLFTNLLDRFALPWDKTVKTFSRGMKMKLSLAVAMAHHPRLLILDEATSGLDPVVRSEMLDLFMEFIQDEDRGILMSTHISSDLEKVSDYIAFIHHGKMILVKGKDELLEQYALVRCGNREYESIAPSDRGPTRHHAFGYDMLITDRESMARKYPALLLDRVTLDDIMVFYAKEEQA
jgi:ABC-2 type transport system ATP-binding protein